MPSKIAAVTVVLVPSSSRVRLDDLGEPVVGQMDGRGELAEGVVARRDVELAQGVDRGAAGDVAAGGAADPVGDHEQVRAGVPGVLVVAADPADVGERGEAQGQDILVCLRVAAHLRSSRMDLPIRIWVPSVIEVGWVIRLLPT